MLSRLLLFLLPFIHFSVLSSSEANQDLKSCKKIVFISESIEERNFLQQSSYEISKLSVYHWLLISNELKKPLFSKDYEQHKTLFSRIYDGLSEKENMVLRILYESYVIAYERWSSLFLDKKTEKNETKPRNTFIIFYERKTALNLITGVTKYGSNENLSRERPWNEESIILQNPPWVLSTHQMRRRLSMKERECTNAHEILNSRVFPGNICYMSYPVFTKVFNTMDFIRTIKADIEITSFDEMNFFFTILQGYKNTSSYPLPENQKFL